MTTWELVYIIFIVAVIITGLTLGFVAFFKRRNSYLFGQARVLHILFGIFMPFVEVILGGIELGHKGE